MYPKDVKKWDYIRRNRDKITGEHIAGSRNIDEVTESFWRAFGIKIKPGKYHTHTGKKGVIDPIVATEKKTLTQTKPRES